MLPLVLQLFLIMLGLVFVFPQIAYVYGRIKGDETLVCVTSVGILRDIIVVSSIDHLFFQVVLGSFKLHRCT